MKIGVSFTPGGLLLPYHVGVLDALDHCGVVTPETPIAGSSAGAIAVAAHAAGVPSQTVLEATIDISDRCQAMGGARGRLLPLLREKLQELITDEPFQRLQERPGLSGVAYREVLPQFRDILQYEYHNPADLIQAVCNSSMFPFFSSNWPVTVDRTGRRFPRLVMDGFFTVPRSRFGAPDFAMANEVVDRTIIVSPFPQDKMRLDAVSREDCISPGVGADVGRLFQIATEVTSRKELTSVYEEGWRDAEEWYRAERSRQQSDSKPDELVLLN